jgi:hypothetical protein
MPEGWIVDSAEVAAEDGYRLDVQHFGGEAAAQHEEVSQLVMASRWPEVAAYAAAHPACMQYVIPSGMPGAGYGLLHTLLAKSCPDYLMEYVMNRTPLAMLGDQRGKLNRCCRYSVVAVCAARTLCVGRRGQTVGPRVEWTPHTFAK